MNQISYAGLFNSATLVAPGVYINVIPPSGSVIRPAVVGVLAMLGIASWGPVNVPSQIGSGGGTPLATFGVSQVRKYDLVTHAMNARQIQAALNSGASLMLTRVSDGTDTSASTILGLTATVAAIGTAGTGYVANDISTMSNGVQIEFLTVTGGVPQTISIQAGAATSQPSNPVAQASTTGVGVGLTVNITTYTKQLTVTSIYTGSGANGDVVTVGTGSAAGTTKITLQHAGFANEVYDNISGSGNTLWVNAAAAINNGNSPQRGPSKSFIATAATATSAATAGSNTLSGGTDGVITLTSSVFIGADGSSTTRTGIYTFRSMGCTHGVVCDLDDHTQNATILPFAQSEGIYWGVQNTAGDTVAAAVTQKASDGTDTPWIKLFMGDWVYANDNVNGGQRLLGPATFGMAMLSVQPPQNAALNQLIPGVVATQQSKSQTGYAQSDLVNLANAGIEVIANPCPGGNYFGMQIGRNASSNGAENNDVWPVLTAFIARSLSGPGALGPAIGQTITPQFFTTWYAVLENYLAGLANATPSPVVQNYQINFGPANNPQSQTATGLVVAEVLIQYFGIAMVFLVNLQAGATVVIPVSQSSFANAA